MRILWMALALMACQGAWAEEPSNYAGAETCYKCHKAIKQSGYANTTHGKIFMLNASGPEQALGCEACHGPAATHADRAGEEEGDSLYINNFTHTPENAAWINSRCLSCHQGKGHTQNWEASAHAMKGLSCVSCHTMHSGDGKVAQKKCESCHVEQRAKLNRASHMPVREGLMGCTNCHNPHGSAGERSLKFNTVNDVCYQCHAEKRGPFLWEHAPVRANCTTCHDPHGSNHASLLKMRITAQCQSCHQQFSHPGALYDGGAVRNVRSTVKACVNCHSMIHGSNHPSGAMFQR